MIQEVSGKYLETRTRDRQRFDLEVGDTKQPEFHPQVKLSRWDNEANFSMRLMGFGAEIKRARTFDGQAVSWVGDGATAKFYDQPDGSGFEFDVIFNQKPASPVVQFSLQHKGLDFHYQPKLTPSEVADGDVRPQEVEGSYAVYHSSRAHNKYGTGKAFHLYRPYIVDANGMRSWCPMGISLNNSILSVAIPRAFYNSADWSRPVRLDPLFGYNVIGGTVSGGATNPNALDLGAITEAGTLDNVNVYIQDFNSNSREGAFAFYGETAGAPGTLLSSNIKFSDAVNDPGWRTEVMSATLTSGERYHIAVFGENGASDLFFDTVPGYTRWLRSGQAFPTFPDPFAQTSSSTNRRYSAYIDYTASGGGGGGLSVPIAYHHRQRNFR